MGGTANGYKVSLWDKNVLKLDDEVLHNLENILKTTDLYILKWWILWYVNSISI